MEICIRRASDSDSAAIKQTDHVAAADNSRCDSIDSWLKDSTVLVAEFQDKIVGYAVFNHAFFHRGNLDMLMVDSAFRGKRIGEQLLTAVEKICDTPKFFVTTNLSNTRMQSLLARCGFRMTGFVGDLDPGDPELVFVKDVTQP